MKILIISAAFPPMHAGEASNTYFLAKHLAKRNLDVHVLTSLGNTGGPDPGITVHPIMRQWSWLELPRFKTFLKRCSPDAILLMYIGLMYNFQPMITFAPTISKKIFPHTPFVTRYESAFVGADPSQTSLIARAFRKFVVQQWAGRRNVTYRSGTLLRDSDQIIALCKQHRALLVAEWPHSQSKTTIIPPPPNIRVCPDSASEARQRGRAILGLPPDEFVIAFLGYLYPGKGVEVLLQAFQKVRHQRSHVRLLFIGGKIDLNVDGGASHFETMDKLSKQLGVDDKIIWTGAFKAEDEEASLFLRAADIGVLPFLQGVQLNNSSFSTMAAHDLPIIATRGPCLDEQFIHGENIFLCGPNDAHALAQSMTLMIDHLELRDRLRSGVQKLSKEWFCWDTAITRTLATFGTKSRHALC